MVQCFEAVWQQAAVGAAGIPVVAEVEPVLPPVHFVVAVDFVVVVAVAVAAAVVVTVEIRSTQDMLNFKSLHIKCSFLCRRSLGWPHVLLSP